MNLHLTNSIYWLLVLMAATLLASYLPSYQTFPTPPPRLSHSSPQIDAAESFMWQDIDEAHLARQASGQRDLIPQRYRLLRANMVALDERLAQAGQPNRRQAETRLSLPLPDGSMGLFAIEVAPLMAPALQAKFPTITTYRGHGLLDRAATIRLDRTPAGFHGLILSNQGTIYIDPYQRGDTSHYLSYYRRDYVKPTRWQDRVIDASATNSAALTTRQTTTLHAGDLLRTYRLAVATTGEYTAFHQQGQPGKAKAMAALVTTINRVSGIYEREVAVSFELVANNERLIYTNPLTDPYSSGDTTALINQNQATIDRLIGPENYDIGHVFGVGTNGLASLSSVCSSRKAQGVTEQPRPVGDPFDVDYVSHEFGHQFGANHTYNSVGARNCTTRNASTAYEPGSGSTIMAYAGTCTKPGDPTINQDLQPHSDAYFHGVSLAEIAAFINDDTPSGGGHCARRTARANQPPTVEAGPSWTIPISTPFRLTGQGRDPNDEPLSYSWEQFDLSKKAWTDKATLPNTDTGSGPIFRSYLPSQLPYRDFPALDNPLSLKGESLPIFSRTLTFRLTGRDGHGGLSYDTTSVRVVDTAGPFVITGLTHQGVWSPGITQTIRWDVAHTDREPFNCQTVDIGLSIDGGRTFPITLATNIPNSGQATVTPPQTVVSAEGHLKISCAEQIFFAHAKVALCEPLLVDMVEGDFANWLVMNGAGRVGWQGKNDGGYSGPYYWFVPDDEEWADAYLISQPLTALDGELLLRFYHAYDLETDEVAYFHGGVVEINVNGDGWRDVGRANFLKHGYNATISAAFDNPLAGRPAFSGHSNTYVESVVDLSSFVKPNDRFEIRFRKTTDTESQPSLIKSGWAIDDILLCGDTPTVGPTITPTVPPILTATPIATATPVRIALPLLTK